MSVYFFEGINGIGKSALIEHLPENILKKKIEIRPELELSGHLRSAAIWKSSMELYRKYADLTSPIVINRSYLSETVYSEALFRDYSTLDMSVLMSLWKYQKATIIYLQRDFPIEVVLKRRPNFKKNFLLEIEKLYDRFLLSSSLDIVRIPIGENPLEQLGVIEKIIK